MHVICMIICVFQQLVKEEYSLVGQVCKCCGLCMISCFRVVNVSFGKHVLVDFWVQLIYGLGCVPPLWLVMYSSVPQSAVQNCSSNNRELNSLVMILTGYATHEYTPGV